MSTKTFVVKQWRYSREWLAALELVKWLIVLSPNPNGPSTDVFAAACTDFCL